MLRYQNGRFHAGGVSFPIPENFYLDTALEITLEAGFETESPDGNMRVCFAYREALEGGSREELLFLTGDKVGLLPIEPVEPVEINGLRGHQFIYEGCNEQCYKVLLDLEGGGCFEVCIVCGVQDDIVAIKHSEQIQNILHSILPDDPEAP